jgi:hypothetical protein
LSPSFKRAPTQYEFSKQHRAMTLASTMNSLSANVIAALKLLNVRASNIKPTMRMSAARCSVILIGDTLKMPKPTVCRRFAKSNQLAFSSASFGFTNSRSQSKLGSHCVGHLNHPAHRRMPPVLHLDPVLRPAGLIVWSRRVQCLPFARPDIRQSLMADSVEKVLAPVGTKFLRAADAFNAVRYGGPGFLYTG